jgi:CRP/FNR family transcriptional regulator
MLLTRGQIKIYREGENGGEFFLCITFNLDRPVRFRYMCKQSQVSHIMAKAVDDELIMVPLTLMEKWMMEHRTWYEFVL